MLSIENGRRCTWSPVAQEREHQKPLQQFTSAGGTVSVSKKGEISMRNKEIEARRYPGCSTSRKALNAMNRASERNSQAGHHGRVTQPPSRNAHMG